jgi:hypothetical protein
MITEQLIIKAVVYFTGITVSLGLVLKSFLIIQVGILPSVLIAVWWAFKWQKSMKLRIETKSLKNKEN